MQPKFGFLSLLFVMPLAMAKPVAVQTCGKDLQLHAPQSQRPVHVPNMAVGQVDEPAGDQIQWIWCSLRTKQCHAKAIGYRYRAFWRVKDFRRGDDDEHDVLAGHIILTSIMCDAAARPQICEGRMKETGHTVIWVVRIPPAHSEFSATGLALSEGNLIGESDGMTAQGDFADKGLLGKGKKGEEDDDDDDEEGDEDGRELLQAKEATLAPIRVWHLNCHRDDRFCQASLLSQGLEANWNVWMRWPEW